MGCLLCCCVVNSQTHLWKQLTKREEELENAEEKVGILDTQKRELEAKCLQLEETLQLQAAAHRIQVEEFEQSEDLLFFACPF
mgnify:CR=1 FL=1